MKAETMYENISRIIEDIEVVKSMVHEDPHWAISYLKDMDRNLRILERDLYLEILK